MDNVHSTNMNKIKHSKIKNTGIIFELLIRQVASDTLSNKDSKALDIIKKYFTNTELAKEQKIYQSLNVKKTLSEAKAEIYISSALELSKRLNRTTLRREKYNLIKEIKDNYNIDSFFNYKLENYKTLASIYNLIETVNTIEFVNPETVITNKIVIMENLTKKIVDKEQIKDEVLKEYSQYDKGTRVLIYKILVEKFNTKYSELNIAQKRVLREYINNLSNLNNLKEYINDSYALIKVELKELIKKVNDPVTTIKLEEVIRIINPIEKNQNVKDINVEVLLQYYQLIKELKEV